MAVATSLESSRAGRQGTNRRAGYFIHADLQLGEQYQRLYFSIARLVHYFTQNGTIAIGSGAMEGVIRHVCWTLCFHNTISTTETGIGCGVNEQGGTASRSNSGKVRMFEASFGYDGVISYAVLLGHICYLWNHLGEYIGRSSHLERNITNSATCIRIER